MTREIKVGSELRAVHIKLLDKTLMKAFSDSGAKPIRLSAREVDSEDPHFSLDLTFLGLEDALPSADYVVELDKLSAFDLHFDYDLSTFIGKTVLVLTSSASRLFNALMVPFCSVECVVEPMGSNWKIAITGVEEREREGDPADFEEVQF
ncbi:MAG: hypothetical protein QXI19_11285 [Candidatus Caldarchaeum sp.]